MLKKQVLIALSLAILVVTNLTLQLPAQQLDTSILKEMKWRNVGPFRGGRTRAVCGVPSQPNVFYIGVVNGGVWKTTDYGRTWQPLFDQQPTGSIGAVAVAPSDPNIVYVGSGEGLHRPDLSVGDGMYKSTDAGATWTHLGLRDGQQIPKIAVDPRILIGCLLPWPDIPMVRILSAEFIARPTAGRRSRRLSTKTRTSAATMWRSIPPIPKWSMPHCGRRVKDRGKTASSAARAGASSSRPMAAKSGSSLPVDCRPALCKLM